MSSGTSDNKPLTIGIIADNKVIGLHPFHVLGDKYLRSVTEGMGAVPLIIPSTGDKHLLEAYLPLLDGLLLTGSPSNIEPHHYQGESEQGLQHDPGRDATSLPLISMALEAGLPILGICRGFQEINVALGGTLHQRVQELPGMMDHREDPEQPVDVQYGLAHPVQFEAGSLLEKITGRDSAEVNSVHQQGIRDLAPGLVVEARAPDGLIEAFRLDKPDHFVFAIQWHPEWKLTENPFYQSIFDAFRAACEARR